MKEYLLVFRSAAGNGAVRTPDEMSKNMESWKNWIGGIAQLGKFIGGQPLMAEGRVLSSNSHITDAPFAEGKEVVNGYLLVNAADYDEAVSLSKACPIFEDKGTVEVREVAKMDM